MERCWTMTDNWWLILRRCRQDIDRAQGRALRKYEEDMTETEKQAVGEIATRATRAGDLRSHYVSHRGTLYVIVLVFAPGTAFKDTA